MTLDLDALEKVAQEATPGPWRAFEDSNEHLADCPPTMEWLVTATDPSEDFYEEIIDWGNRGRREDAEHIAAFDPPTVLALIAEAREGRESRDGTTISKLAEVEAERDVLGRAAFAAILACGVDTDGAKTWEEYFRPMVHPSWVDDVHQNVTSLAEERDEASEGWLKAEAERDALQAKLDRVEDFMTAHCLDTRIGKAVLEVIGEGNGDRT